MVSNVGSAAISAVSLVDSINVLVIQKEDMLQVEYPNCFLLDMGWYQDRYIISVIHNFDWANPVQQYETTETNQLPKLLTEAVRLVEKESQSAGAN